MTSGLRKVHKFSWVLIAIAGIVFLLNSYCVLYFQKQLLHPNNVVFALQYLAGWLVVFWLVLLIELGCYFILKVDIE